MVSGHSTLRQAFGFAARDAPSGAMGTAQMPGSFSLNLPMQNSLPSGRIFAVSRHELALQRI
jgi:hypothetical protein